MPIYEYQCENGHRFEAFQSMSDEALDTCPDCGAAARRLMRAPAINFKGSGFYNTDYGKQKKSGTTAPASESSGSDSSTPASKSESTASSSESKSK